MFYFSSDTIYNACQNLINCPAQVGGIISILSILDANVESLKTYSIDSKKLKLKLSEVFDKTPETDFTDSESKYIVFAKNWEKQFFDGIIKEKIDLLSIAIFFLRRQAFSEKVTKKEIISFFLKEHNISEAIQTTWFIDKSEMSIEFNSNDPEKNQEDFYKKRFGTVSFNSITFKSTIQKYSYEFSAAAHIQTLYSGNDIKKSFIYSDVSLDSYYNFSGDNTMTPTKPYTPLNYIPLPNDQKIKEYNRIIFGAPGTGKSFELNKYVTPEKKEYAFDKNHFERVTFHPEYSYAQFVGCYKPVSKGSDIFYEYVPGPFMRTLAAALESGKKGEAAEKYLLIVEEINRAKVAAVFGDMFQLLDRNENGESEYEIQASEDVRRYLAEKLGGTSDDYSILKIPNNMYIWATMNSADQGVQPMDTAFKRRWEGYEYIGINSNDSVIKDVRIPLPVPQGGYELFKWNEVRKELNRILKEEANVNEDKLMGPFFISKHTLDEYNGKKEKGSDFTKLFKSKILMYLFEDAAKMAHSKVFPSDGKKLHYSDICEKFDKDGLSVFGLTADEYKAD